MATFQAPGVLQSSRPTSTVDQMSFPGGTPVSAAILGPIRTVAANPPAPVQVGFAIDKDGKVLDAGVIPKLLSTIEHGAMKTIHGIIVHQTGGSTAQSTLSSYAKKDAHGAHFLIDKDGTIYQTASLYKITHHVGLLKPRCVLEKSCSPVDIKSLGKLKPKQQSTIENAKAFPTRLPNNSDSIGIEIVGAAIEQKKGEPVYEAVNDAQNAALGWLVKQLSDSLGVPLTEVYRHPTVSWKNVTEASTAKW
jgi:N-acetylmuramoyl-L-alanine amidase